MAKIFIQWNYGVSGNIAQARSLIGAIRDTGFQFGIYSSPGVSFPLFFQKILRQKKLKLRNKNQEWSTLFGSTSFVLDNSAPLWFATYNNVEVGISPQLMCSTLKSFFFFLIVDSRTKNSFRRVSPSFISVYCINWVNSFIQMDLCCWPPIHRRVCVESIRPQCLCFLIPLYPLPLLNLGFSLVVCTGTSGRLIFSLSEFFFCRL